MHRGPTTYYKCPWCCSGLTIRKMRKVERHSRDCAKRPKDRAGAEATETPQPLFRKFLSLLRRAPLPPQVPKSPKVRGRSSPPTVPTAEGVRRRQGRVPAAVRICRYCSSPAIVGGD